MSTIHGIPASPASSFLNAPTKAQAPARSQGPKPEFQETAQEERQEVMSSRQEVGERAPSAPGSRFSITA